MTAGEDCFANIGLAATVNDCCVMSEEEYWFLQIGHLKFRCNGLLGWFSLRDGSPDRLDVPWCIRSVRSCSCTNGSTRLSVL